MAMRSVNVLAMSCGPEMLGYDREENTGMMDRCAA